MQTKQQRADLQQHWGDLSEVCVPGKRIPFRHYFRQLESCRAVLAPAGNARWTYRHYEAVYTQSVVLSTDLRSARLLVPIPDHNTVMIPDHQPLLPIIEQALSQNDLEAGRENVKALEEYLHYGRFSRQRPLPWERFAAQIQGDALPESSTEQIIAA